MSAATSIEWTDRTWNPVRGCSRVSEGCRNCYAERIASRFSRHGQPFAGFAKHNVGDIKRFGWTGTVSLIPDKLDEPLRWRKPSRIFVNSMSDLFHEKLATEDIEQVFAVMALAPQHTFQILTKRPERMLSFLAAPAHPTREQRVFERMQFPDWLPLGRSFPRELVWPLPNVWLGVSVEDQATADERIPLLLQTPAAVRFVSYEPALGPVHFDLEWLEPFKDVDPALNRTPRIDWLIVGGESGPGARPCDVAWIRSAVRQCREAGVACFVKQLGTRPVLHPMDFDSIGPYVRHTDDPDDFRVRFVDRKGGDPSEWPEDLRIREFPR